MRRFLCSEVGKLNFLQIIKRLLPDGELWLLALIFLCLVVVLASIIKIFRRASWHHRCSKCNYDLHATESGQCPECGLLDATTFQLRFIRPYIGIAGLATIIVVSFFISWPDFWVGVRIAFGNTVTVHKEIDLGHGVVVHDCEFIVTSGDDMYGHPIEGVRVMRNGTVIFKNEFFSSAEYFRVEDLNGNGTLDFRYGYGAQGSGSYEFSEIIDPLYDEIYEVESEYFFDTNGDGLMECYDREDSLLYTWNYGVDKLRVNVVKSWDKEYGKNQGWTLDVDKCGSDPPTQDQFQEYIFEIRACIEDHFENQGSVYLGCIAPKMAMLCYSGHPALAFELLDQVWLGGEEEKFAFELEFVEELRSATFVEVTARFGLFDVAGKRRCADLESQISQDPTPYNSSPHFEDFATTEYLSQPPIQPKRESGDETHWVKGQWLADPEFEPNFAGHIYAFVVGCGTNCKLLCFVDLRNGKLLDEMSIVFSCAMSDDSLKIYKPKYRIDSRLLIVPCLVDSDGEGFHYMEYVDGNIVKLTTQVWDTQRNNGDY